MEGWGGMGKGGVGRGEGWGVGRSVYVQYIHFFFSCSE